MELGFETIGNATLICYDRGPVLVTDPWTEGAAYFGSWIHQHTIPKEQRAAIQAAPYVWISHGHPDHLSVPSLEHKRSAAILLPDHVGGRIQRELSELGFAVRVLPDGKWVELSPRLRVMSLANLFQDAVLLVDLDGRSLLVNANDAGDRGASDLLRREVARFPRSFLTALMAYGDADMIHLFREDGSPIPHPNAHRPPLQPGILGHLDHYGISAYVPFATLHQYQRTDSLWANQHVTRPADLAPRDAAEARRILPAYVSYDALADSVRAIDPPEVPVVPMAPEVFGDSWDDPLTAAEAREVETYFRRFSHLSRVLGTVEFRVGGRDLVVAFDPKHPRGVRFETPRASLLSAVRWQVFDDLMIGNFTRTTLLGDWQWRGVEALYPDFNPFVTKFGDNGGAHSREELCAYFAAYGSRGFTDFDPRPESQALKAALAPYLPPSLR